MEKIVKTTQEWREELSPEQYRVLREKGTERAFTGKYYNSSEKGIFTCAACGNELFASATKYESGSGWPSFYDVVHSDSVNLIQDNSHGMQRVEVVCAKCESHLGHVFPDGPQPTGQRYCINSVCLDLKKD